jgi:hypothetical protein
MPNRVGDQYITKGNIEKLMSDTGFKPKVGINQGLEKQVDYFLNSISV